MTNAAIIVAAGRGTRAGGDIPKQWQDLRGKPVIAHAFHTLRGVVDRICVVIDPADRAQWDATGLRADRVVQGGATRDASVRAGLDALTDAAPENVLIHDAARPLLTRALAQSVLDRLANVPAAAPGVAVTDALWIGAEGVVMGVQDRTALHAAQTPQGFRYPAILAAHRAHRGPAADDVAVARTAGLDVAIVPGDPDNIKITGPADLARAARLLEAKAMDVRVGNGFDVHAFGPGDHVMLCGVAVPHVVGLKGHSDADVGLHAITDAIYGALGAGDIGTHFPPSDPQWKGAESYIFLRHACDLARKRGFQLTHLDCTLICERPKIGPHQGAMRARLAEITGLAPDRISAKATTSERLGFTGREEGIAAMATATLVAT